MIYKIRCYPLIWRLIALLLKSILYLLLLLGALPLQAQTLGGLKFHGSEQPINERTSYDVFGNQSAEFADRFDVEFNLALYPTTEFGYIVRIKNRVNNRIFHLFYDGQGGGNLMFKFNEEGRSNLIVADMGRDQLLRMNWFKVKISFDLHANQVTLSINDQAFQADVENLPDTYSPIILFGRSDHIIDVPSFAIKDLEVGNTEKYVFDLKESEGTAVHDHFGKTYGVVANPEWLINDAYHWRAKAAFRSKSVAGANYNPEKKEIYYFNKDSLTIYDARSGRSTHVVFPEPNPVKLKLGTNFIDPETNKLYSYELYNENYNGPSVAALDLSTYKWTAENSQQMFSPLHHHGSYFDQSTGQFTIFGGFGRMLYSKDFFTYDLNKRSWDTLKGFSGDFLTPRYFSSVGYLKQTNSIYVFGGMGNESGEQTVGRKYYYDLYKIDLNTRAISKLWEIEWNNDNMVPVRGMVILNDSSFYTLCYPESISQSLLKLYKFSLKDGKYEILGDSIPIHSDKITTNANLYYDNDLNRLFAVVQEFEDDISSDLKVYTLSFPPITSEELASLSQAGNQNVVVGGLITIGIILIAGIGYLVYRNRLKNKEEEEGQASLEHIDQHAPVKVTRANSIYLFGEFTVYDRKNRNITYMFSAQLKQIFSLILQYSTTEGGIASQRLSGILWPDKPADKVKNSRGVTINHLRKVLSELDGIELIYDKGHFKIEQKEGFYCDYTRCIEIISSNEEEKYRSELVEIISRGKFLQLSDHELYDSFKDEVEKKLEPVLLVEMEKSFNGDLPETAISFAQAISNIDPLNETALNYHIKALQRLKMNDEAKIRYQAFIIEYKKAIGSEYPHPYPASK